MGPKSRRTATLIVPLTLGRSGARHSVLGRSDRRARMMHGLPSPVPFCLSRGPFMALDEKRFPELIRELYNVVVALEAMFPGRPFTPDGHMVGSLAECFAEYFYGLKLY